MRITVEIDEHMLRAVKEETGIYKTSPAVKRVIESFLDQRAREKVVQEILLGGIDFELTNEELEEAIDFTPRHFHLD